MIGITKPVIIIGTGRCGSTVLHQLLSAHPQLMWLSGYCDRYPNRPDINRRLVIAMGNPLFRRVFGRKVRPDECYRFWDWHAYGFSEPCRDLLRTDVTPIVKKRVREVMKQMLTPARHRLLIKITGWSRLGYLNEIFEDAKFVHLIRDGRAVSSSLLHVGFWRGWQGPHGWRAGPLTAKDQTTWDSYERSFVALAALEWRIRMRAVEEARRAVDPARLLEVRYEDLCQQPEATLRAVLEFAELPSSREAAACIAATPVEDQGDRWRHRLTIEQHRILDELLDDDLRRYGYVPARAA